MDIGCCIMKSQTQGHIAHGFTTILSGVNDVNVFVSCDDVIYDEVIKHIRGSTARKFLIDCRIAFGSTRVSIFIVDVENKKKIHKHNLH